MKSGKTVKQYFSQNPPLRKKKEVKESKVACMYRNKLQEGIARISMTVNNIKILAFEAHYIWCKVQGGNRNASVPKI